MRNKIVLWCGYVLCVTLVAIFSLLFGVSIALAETSGTCGDNLTWVLDDNGMLTISGKGKMDNFGKMKWGSGTTQPWYSYARTITSIQIKDGVTSIGDDAFSSCTALTSISIPDSVTGIGNNAFLSCTSLTNISIPSNVTSIGEYAFDNCIRLTSITIPSSVINIGSHGFYNCTNLTNIIIPNSVTSIGNYAFSNCTSLTNIMIPDSVTSIGDYAFDYCTTLTDISISNNVTSIGACTFRACTSLSHIVIPDNVTSIGSNAFERCTSLKSITIPNSVTSIHSYVFDYCTSLTTITIPDSVTSIGSNLFSNCTNLTNITISNRITYISESTFKGCTSLTSIVIPDSVTSINDYAFYNCNSLTEITIPGNVTRIGYDAFRNCTSLRNITIPDSVTYINSYTFYNCTNLQSITIPDSVDIVGKYVFCDCSNLTNITIPKSTSSICEYTFSGCISLKSIIIPNSVTNIDAYAFDDCRSLLNITIPYSVTSIGEKAFNSKVNTLLFTLKDESTSLSFNSNMFGTTSPTIYCYMFSAVDAWATSQGYNIVYLDDINIDDIRTITLPDDFRLAVGESRQLTASLFPDDHAVINWHSSDPAVAQVEDGLVMARNAGTATITATVGSVSASIVIDTYIPATDFELNTSEAWVLAKNPLQLSAVSFTPANANADITWVSSDTTCATVNQSGLVTTILPGDVTITATTEQGIARQCLLHLCYPVTAVNLTAPRDSLAMRTTLHLTADVTMRTQTCVNHLVTFTSSDESIAVVDSESGLVSGISKGEVTITAEAANGVSASCVLIVREPNTLVLPASLTIIKSQAFADLPNIEIIVLPETVTTIDPDAFDPSVTLQVPNEALADWAESHGYSWILP